MHTDEYEISLARELAVCEQYVRKFQKLLAELKREPGGSPSSSVEREQAQASLLRWSRTRDEYARLLAAMRQSAPS
jgi:hypothetical protein